MHKDVYEYLVESGISCEYMEKEKHIKIFIQIEEKQYELRMKFPQYYPYEFPEIYIEDQKELCIPHLYTDNKLCLYDTNEVLPNPERYREEALESVRRAKDLLVSSEKQENIIDYQIEALSFWDAKATGKIDYLGSENTDTHLLWSCEWLDDWFVVADTQDKIEEFFDNSYGLQKPKNAIFKKALFINIGTAVLVHLYTIQGIHDLIPQKELSKFYSFLVNNQGEGVIILCVDNGIGSCLLALKINLLSNGIKLSYRNIKGMLAANKSRKFKRLKLKNFEMKRLFTRGGDGSAVFDKKCLLVGCGSIGSYVSKAIIDTGITDNITLLDNDNLNIENLARHLCGSQYLLFPKPKSEVLKSELLKHYPAMKCNSIVGNVWEYLLNRCSLINDFDIIWVCVGNTVIEKKIIQLIKEKIIHKECIILWVEPYLIAGHALILQKEIDESTEKSIFDVNGAFNNNVLNDSKEYLKSEAGCQSAYAPYAGFEAQKFVLDFLDVYYRKVYSKEEKHNYEFTWIGKMKWARQKKFNIKSKWRAKEDRFMELKRIDNQ